MATKCIFSAGLALPAAFRQTLRTEFGADLRSSSVHHCARPRTLHSRCFSSTPRSCAIQVKPHGDLIAELSASTPSDSSSKKPTDVAAQTTSTTPSSETISTRSKKVTKDDTSTTPKKNAHRKGSDQDPKSDKAKKVSNKRKKPEHWQVQKGALEKKFPAGWNPPKKLSPDAMDGIRHLHATAPDRFTTTVLAEEFKISPEAIRRILKSKWRPSEAEMDSRRKRWEKRHDRIWSRMAELGLRPSTKRTRPLSDANTLYRGDKEDKRV